MKSVAALHTGSNWTLPDVFSTAELALATRTSDAAVQAWVEAGAIRTLPAGDGITWLARDEAMRSGRALLDGTIAASLPALTSGEPRLFAPPTLSSRTLRGPLALSGTAHLGVLVAVILITTIGLGPANATTESPVDPDPLRMVYLALPGPGGGGGGGGVHALTPPPTAERKGAAHIDSPVPEREPPPPVEPPKPEPPTIDPEPTVQAPVVQTPADPRDRPGVIAPSATADSRGLGDGGGVGTGMGTGIGEGTGPGIGEGEGGGTGGGPYRPGSGIEPPTIAREVKPDYTEEARQRGIRGEVVMEIVVKRDGTVGDVKVLEGLGHGLDERAVDAVRQWTFHAATRKGTPVDVLVEVAMEFKLR